MRIMSAFLLVSLLMANCSDEKDCSNACNCDNPLKKFTWLQDLKNTITDGVCEVSLLQGTYNGQTIFYIQMTDPFCEAIDTPTLYNCDGELVRIFTFEDHQDFYTEVTMTKTLYTSKKTDS